MCGRLMRFNLVYAFEQTSRPAAAAEAMGRANDAPKDKCVKRNRCVDTAKLFV